MPSYFKKFSDRLVARQNPTTLLYATRTAVAALASLLISRQFRLPESYWAAVSTLVVVQSTRDAALSIAVQRFAGTALGAFSGALLGQYFQRNGLVFAVGILALGALCTALRLERGAHRYASIALAIVMLVARVDSPWVIAIHRFFEVSLGIAVGLIVTWFWPERTAISS
jgi:uncharacterized membrane protein YccC